MESHILILTITLIVAAILAGIATLTGTSFRNLLRPSPTIKKQVSH